MIHLGLPDNPHDRAMRDHLHPADWQPPVPVDRYNLVVLGGGPAGLIAALGAAGMGGKVALVERDLLGGDCLVAGCVPSKAVLRAAHAAHAVRDAARFGVTAGAVDVDFAAAMDRMRQIRASIAPHDSASRLKQAGVDVFLGTARFGGAEVVDVHNDAGEVTSLRFARAMIATGARAALPPIPGLDTVGAHTNETLFDLTTLPRRLTVVGAGVIGCEMAQAFARLGSQVALIDMADRVLPREEPDASEIVRAQLVLDGVALHLGASVAGFERDGTDRVTLLGDGQRLAADEVLVALGRRANLDLDLKMAGVQHTKHGVTVDDYLRTTNPSVYAAGDVIGQAAFTHAADHHARIVVRNALFFGRARVSKLIIPRVTFTQPEVAAVGLSQADAHAAGLAAYTVPMGETDRGRTDGERVGYARVFTDSAGRIHGATIVSEQAGELLAPITLSMTHGLRLGQLASTIHPYPTRSEVLFKVASAFNRTRLTPRARRWSTWLLGLRR